MRPSDEIIENATEIDSLNPYCNKLDIDIDRDKVWESFNQLFISLGLDYDTFIKTEYGYVPLPIHVSKREQINKQQTRLIRG